MPKDNQDNPNRVETEEDGLRAGQLRLLQARHRSQVFRDQTRALSLSLNNTPVATASTSDDSQNTPQ